MRTLPITNGSAVGHQPSAYGVGFDQHSAHARGRPIAWIVVAVIIAGTCTSGISLIMATPWLFWTGVGIVVGGVILGRATHAMRDEMVPSPGTSARQPNSQPTAEHSAAEFALMSGRTVCALARAGWGATLCTAPSRILAMAGHRRPSRTATDLVRVLGARHLVQAGVVLMKPSRTVTRAGGVVDALHALSDVAVAAVSPRWRTAATADAVLAASFAFLSWRYPTRRGGSTAGGNYAGKEPR